MKLCDRVGTGAGGRRSPHGERGLKSAEVANEVERLGVAPLTGSVNGKEAGGIMPPEFGRKSVSHCGYVANALTPARCGAVIPLEVHSSCGPYLLQNDIIKLVDDKIDIGQFFRQFQVLKMEAVLCSRPKIL